MSGHDCGHPQPEDHRPADGTQGPQPEAGGHEELLGEGVLGGAAHEPRDHLSAAGHFQPPAGRDKPLLCEEPPGGCCCMLSLGWAPINLHSIR